MTTYKICRVCLRRNVKMYHCNGFQLKKFYEEILELKVSDDDNLPKYFCFECAAMLHKFHKFKEKCRNGRKALLDVLKNDKISYRAVSKIDRKSKKLQSKLDIIAINERVKTISIRSRAKQKRKKDEKPIEVEDELKTEESGTTESVFVDENIEHECKDIEKVILFVNDDKITEENISNNVDKSSYNIVDDEKTSLSVVDDKISGDDGIIVDCDEGADKNFSSDDDYVLSDLVKEKDLKDEKEENIEGVAIAVEEIPNEIENKKKKKKKAKGLKRIVEEKEPPKITLDPKNWERRYLSEEEAETEFKKKALDAKYLGAAFQCTTCFKGFSQKDMLIRHNRKKHSEGVGRIECRFCRARFKWRCHLSRHLHQHYNLYKCLRCHLVCNLESTALLHEEHHNGIVKKCEYCGQEYTHTSTYYSHLRSHRSAFVCALCGQSFVSEAGLRFHKILKHLHQEPKEREKSEQEQEEDTYCERCKMKFETREAFEQHYLHSAMHSVGSAAEGAEDSPAPALIKARSRVIRRSPRKPRTCPTCGTSFRTQTAFFQHRCVEHAPLAAGVGGALGGDGALGGVGAGAGGRPFKGPTGRSYRNAEKNICEICGQTVASVYMEQHINTHTHRKAYECGVCGVKLFAQSSLKRHQLTHTGERPYPCPLCEKRFTQSNSMKLHYRTFHLKEPYPKRNRRKKTAEEVSVMEFST